MKTRLKKFLNRHKNRIFSFIAVIACIPLLSINSYAAYSTYPQYDMSIPSTSSWQKWDGQIRAVANMVTGDDSNYHFTGQQGWVDNAEIFIPTYLGNSFETDDKFYFPINTDLFDYYLIATLSTDLSPAVYNGSKFSVGDWDIGNITDWAAGTFVSSGLLIDKKQYYTSYDYDDGNNGGVQLITFTAKLNLDFIGDFNVGCFHFTDINYCHYNSTKMFSCSVIVANKGDTSAYNDIVTAINNQTDTLGGYIDKGNDSTGGIVSGNNSSIDNLDDVVSEYRATEETFFNDFNTNQQAITSDIVGWSWGGLVNCANWVGETLTSYYNNMGDFRQYIIYPLMLGIALFFLGRGGSIIGHLFRKPTETTVNTKSVFRREGNTRYTTTTTSRQGGVFRK